MTNSTSNLAEDLINLFISAKKMAIEYKDYKIYKDFLDDSKKHWTAFYLECTTEAGKGLVAEILKTTKKELEWVEGKIAESKVPF